MDGKPLNILLTSWEGSNTGQICSNIRRKNPHIEHRIEPLNANIPKESLKHSFKQYTTYTYNIVQLSHNLSQNISDIMVPTRPSRVEPWINFL